MDPNTSGCHHWERHDCDTRWPQANHSDPNITGCRQITNCTRAKELAFARIAGVSCMTNHNESQILALLQHGQRANGSENQSTHVTHTHCVLLIRIGRGPSCWLGRRTALYCADCTAEQPT